MKVSDVRFVAGAMSMAQVPKDDRAQVAIIGPSNVGKSSLINALVGQRGVARVSKTPGRTQQLNFFLVDERFYLVDLPGYGFAKVPKSVQARFLALIEQYLSQSSQLRLLLLLLDSRRMPSSHDVELARWLRDNRVPHAIVLTKADKMSRSQLMRQERGMREALAAGGADPGAAIVACSAVTGAGRRETWSLITGAVAPRGARPSAPEGGRKAAPAAADPAEGGD